MSFSTCEDRSSSAQNENTDIGHYMKEIAAFCVTVAKSAAKEQFFHRISRITTKISIPIHGADFLWCDFLDGLTRGGLESSSGGCHAWHARRLNAYVPSA
jgi:hypothetical protein